jgi:hypothetical protein
MGSNTLPTPSLDRPSPQPLSHRERVSARTGEGVLSEVVDARGQVSPDPGAQRWDAYLFVWPWTDRAVYGRNTPAQNRRCWVSRPNVLPHGCSGLRAPVDGLDRCCDLRAGIRPLRHGELHRRRRRDLLWLHQ